MLSRKAKEDYKVAIVTALPFERVAVTAMLDERHPAPAGFTQHLQDPNSYTWGSIASHHIVVASSSTGVYGTTNATTTVLPMIYAFPKIEWGIMVGVGSGVPSHGRDIRLGDVAVSQPAGGSAGLVQYDLGKLIDGFEWKRSNCLAEPPDILLKALGNLQVEHELNGSSKAQQHLLNAFSRYPNLTKSFVPPPPPNDLLFEASYTHDISKQSCNLCDSTKIIPRAPREEPDFRIHYGIIASGNSLIKNASLREKLFNIEDQCICIEMETAGLTNNFPCLVVRGICDYGDSHKNDTWQRYASATAAAFTKELLIFSSKMDATFMYLDFCSNASPPNATAKDKQKTINNVGGFHEKTAGTSHSEPTKPQPTPVALGMSYQTHSLQRYSSESLSDTKSPNTTSILVDGAVSKSSQAAAHEDVIRTLDENPILASRLNISYKHHEVDIALSTEKGIRNRESTSETPHLLSTSLAEEAQANSTEVVASHTAPSLSLNSRSSDTASHWSDGGTSLFSSNFNNGEPSSSGKDYTTLANGRRLPIVYSSGPPTGARFPTAYTTLQSNKRK